MLVDAGLVAEGGAQATGMRGAAPVVVSGAAGFLSRGGPRRQAGGGATSSRRASR